MAAFTGTRFGFDSKHNVQYKLTFKDGQIVTVMPVANNSLQLRRALQTGQITVYDDEVRTAEIGGRAIDMRPVYSIILKSAGGILAQTQTGEVLVSSYEVTGVDKDDLLPPQHADGNPRAKAEGARAMDNKIQTTQANPVKDMLDAVSGVQTNPTTPTTPVTEPGRKLRAGEMPTNRKFKYNDAALNAALKPYSIDLTERARNNELDPVIGREKERQDIRQFLLRKKRSSVMLLGEAGVGKTALAEALAQDIADGKAEAELANARVVSLNLRSMAAGAGIVGEFEKRLMPILEGLEERNGYINGQKIILFIDEIHNALGSGTSMGSKGAGQIMKPYLSSGAITCIGATTPDEYKNEIESDKAMVRRFQPYTIEEPDNSDTKVIVEAVMQGLSDYHWMEEPMSKKMVEYVVRMTNRFMPNQFQPDKSLGIIDDAHAIARAEERTLVTEKDVVHAISKATGLKEDFLNQSDFEKYATLGQKLSERVLGQDAVLELAEDLAASRMGLTQDDAPRGVFLFTGPTGVGKTEAAKQLAELLTGDVENLVRIDMGKYQEKHTVSGLIGSPPGYVGYNDNAGELTEPVRNRPFSIVLLDEIEKAHPDVFKTFLPIFDDGEATDAKGRKVDFRNTIFVLTSNLGAAEIQSVLSGKKAGFDTSNTDADIDESNIDQADRRQVAAIAEGAIKRHFPPELYNRVDGIYPFFHLNKKTFNALVDMRLKKVEKSLKESPNGLQLSNVTLEVADKVRDVLREKGYDKQYGARPLERALRRELSRDFSKWMMENKADLLENNEKGPFKITIKDLGEKFNAKIIPFKQEDKKPAPAKKKPAMDKPAA